MNRILVIGAAGMVGRKLLQKLAQDGSLGGSQIAHATLHDIVAPQLRKQRPPAVVLIEMRIADVDRRKAALQRLWLGHRFAPATAVPHFARSACPVRR